MNRHEENRTIVEFRILGNTAVFYRRKEPTIVAGLFMMAALQGDMIKHGHNRDAELVRKVCHRMLTRIRNYNRMQYGP